MDFKKHHRSLNAICRAANAKGLFNKADEWTETEDAILKTWYEVEGETAFKRLPSRTVSGCRGRVQRLGLIRHEEWSSTEDNILIQYYPKEGPACFAKLRERSDSACRNRVRTLGLAMEFRPTGALWSETELEILKTYYPTEGSAVVDRLVDRTAATVKRQARVLGIKYTGAKRHTGQKQVRCIETDIVYSSAKEAATALNISYKMVQACASGTKKSGGGYHWEYVD
jgi:hypothetical protein